MEIFQFNQSVMRTIRELLIETLSSVTFIFSKTLKSNKAFITQLINWESTEMSFCAENNRYHLALFMTLQ